MGRFIYIPKKLKSAIVLGGASPGVFNNAANTITYTGVSFGTPSADRLIVIAIQNVGTSGGSTPASVTIGGVPATFQGFGSTLASGGFYVANVPTGASGDVVVQFPASNTWTAAQGICAAWALYGVTNPFRTMQTFTAASNATSVTHNFAATVGRVVIALAEADAPLPDVPSWAGGLSIACTPIIGAATVGAQFGYAATAYSSKSFYRSWASGMSNEVPGPLAFTATCLPRANVALAVNALEFA